MPKAVPPLKTPNGDGYTLSHPAFASMVLSHVSGGSGQVFGSPLDHHLGRIRISVMRAETHRSLHHDHLHPKLGETIVTWEMTHAQFAQFITGVGRGEGTPITLTDAPNTRAVEVPGIQGIPSVSESAREEVGESVEEHLKDISEEVTKLEEMVLSGSFPKKDLKEIVRNLRRHVEQAPGSLQFSVKSAEDAIERATAHAKIEVESFVTSVTKSLGVERLAELTKATDAEHSRINGGVE